MRGTLWVLVSAGLAVAGCGESDAPESTAEEIIRGLKTVVVKDTEKSMIRRYPSVIQPAELTTLSFETAGRLTKVDLRIGQKVKQDDVLIALDPESLTLQVDNADAALRQAQATARNARSNLARQDELAKKGVVSQSQFDQAKTDADTAAAQVAQARKQHDIAKDNLSKAVLKAPFDATVHTVEVDSFANITAGAPVVSLYRAQGFDVSFSVSYDISNKLTVGKPVLIRLADNPAVTLSAQIKELGARADTVSSFPVVASLSETTPDLKAGMAVEVSVEFDVDGGEGLTVPLSVFALKGEMKEADNASSSSNDRPRQGIVYIFDDQTSTVRERKVTVAGIRENKLIVIDGLAVGERVASAGVSFLRDGQRVKLLSEQGR